VRFAKWHGLGNDYLLIERADAGRPLDPATVRRLCDVHVGIGADGVLEVVDVDASRAEVVVWNPDGSTAELSGNGTRIAARWLARRSGVDEVVIAVGERQVVSRCLGGAEVEQRLGIVAVGPPEFLDLAGESVEMTPVSIGNPHAVIRREPDRDELLRLGPLVETNPRFPDRTNVQLIRVDGRSEITVGVWERGAGETPSSGTSACAAAAASIANGWCESPILVHLPGGDLRVAIGEGWQTVLTGPAREICTGELSPELLADIAADGR
jgi:diaminopimelate epimerase